MIQFILLIFILVNPISAVGSDFYDGLAGGELIGDLNTPDSFGEVSNVDLAEWSTLDKYENIASNANQKCSKVASSVNNTGGLELSEVSHALSNQGGVDHAANHLSESGLLEGRS